MSFEIKSTVRQEWRKNLKAKSKIVLQSSFLYFGKEVFREGDLKRILRKEDNPFAIAYQDATRRLGSYHSLMCNWQLHNFDRIYTGLRTLVKYELIETWKDKGKRYFRITNRGHKLLADWYYESIHLVDPSNAVRLVAEALRKAS